MSRTRFVPIMVLIVLTSACMSSISTNSVEVLNLTEETLMIHKASGDEDARRVLPREAANYIVPRGGCMDDRLVAVDPEGNVVGEIDQPCGGTQWVLEEDEAEG